MSQELKACAHCGGEAYIHHPFSNLDRKGLFPSCFVKCKSCMLSTHYSQSEAEAITAWNRRAQPERKLTDAEIHDIWEKSHKVAKKEDGLIIAAHMNQPVVFARALLAAQPAAATVLQWISVKDRLPEVGELFLTVDEDSDLELLTLGGIKRHFGCITHWMPLPQPPAAQPAQDDGEKL